VGLEMEGGRVTGVKGKEGRVWRARDVLSTVGVIKTFDELVTQKEGEEPENFNALEGRRPVLRVMVGLKGTKEELELTGADFWRLPACGKPRDRVDASPMVGTGNAQKRVVMGDVGVEAPGSFVPGKSWVRMDFQSAKDPLWEERFGGVSTCVVSVEADSDILEAVGEGEGEGPKRYKMKGIGERKGGELKEKVLKDLVGVFPQLEGKVVFTELSKVVQEGLSHTPVRFAAKCVKSSTKYPGLWLGGEDTTVESFFGKVCAGVISCNSMVGYTALDLLGIGKNVSADVAKVWVEAKGGQKEEEILSL